MQLSARELFRLYSVSENLNEDGVYPLESFDDEAFNENIDADDLNGTLNELADATYGQGSRWYEITDDTFDSAGNIYIEVNDDDRLRFKTSPTRFLPIRSIPYVTFWSMHNSRNTSGSLPNQKGRFIRDNFSRYVVPACLPVPRLVRLKQDRLPE